MSSSTSRPASVRGLYSKHTDSDRGQVPADHPAPPSEEWVFLPPTVSAPTSKLPPAPSHLPTPTPMLPDDDDTSGAYGPIQLFAAEYFSTALGMPFEVGKTLLQIEYRPRKRFDTTPDEAKVVFEVEEEEVSPYAGNVRPFRRRTDACVAGEPGRSRHVLYGSLVCPFFIFRPTRARSRGIGIPAGSCVENTISPVNLLITSTSIMVSS